jgi:hypothetical protein
MRMFVPMTCRDYCLHIVEREDTTSDSAPASHLQVREQRRVLLKFSSSNFNEDLNSSKSRSKDIRGYKHKSQTMLVARMATAFVLRATVHIWSGYPKHARGFVRTISLTSDDEKHEFTGVYIVNITNTSWHQRKCKKCGVAQKYGRLYGSNKYPGFQAIDPKCPGSSGEGRDSGGWPGTTGNASGGGRSNNPPN